MYEPHERIVELSKTAYAELLQALLPEERWFDAEHNGHVLFVQDYADGDTRKLVFRYKRD